MRLTNITAPMTGTVSKLDVEEGETVVGTSQMQGTEMLRIADLSKMEVRVDVNENDIIKINVGDEVDIDVDSYSYMDKTFRGKVTQIANSANDKVSADAVTEFEVRIIILNESYQDLATEENPYPFRPGMTASVDIITEKKDDILTVPLSAVTTREPDDEDGNEGEDQEIEEIVFVAKDGKAVKTVVKTGISDFERIEILSGLEENDRVVSGPFIEVSRRLRDGKLIEYEAEKEETQEKGKDTEEETEEEG
jgi:HlyD family secretion protein